jgi:hypothetical protein
VNRAFFVSRDVGMLVGLFFLSVNYSRLTHLRAMGNNTETTSIFDIIMSTICKFLQFDRGHLFSVTNIYKRYDSKNIISFVVPALLDFNDSN